MPGGPKTARKDAYMAALLAGHGREAAAKLVGIAVSTAARWGKEPEFVERYRQARQEQVEAAANLLRDALGEAVRTLREALADENTTNRIRAASLILEHAVRAQEVLDLSERIDALEAAIAAKPRRVI